MFEMKSTFLSFLIVLTFSFFVSFFCVLKVQAYSTNMSASVVLGQPNFTSSAADQGGTVNANTLQTPRGVFIDPNGRLIVADAANHRILIWNSVPSSSNTSADLVLGQENFTSDSANRGGSVAANTMNAPHGVFSDGTKLVVNDRSNQRTLIWNTFPTQNGQDADVVVGQSSMTTNTTGSCNFFGLDDPAEGVWIYNNKLLIGSKDDHRVLVWNTVPTTNGVAADVTIGRPIDTCDSSGATQYGLNQPRGLTVDKNG